MLPDQPDNPTRPKILHPQHARPPPHPHHLSGEPSSLFKTCSRSKVQVIQNSVTMHTLLGYQSRVSTIRSQVGVLITRNRLFTWNNRFLQQHHHPLFTCKQFWQSIYMYNAHQFSKVRGAMEIALFIQNIQEERAEVATCLFLPISISFRQVALYIFSRNQSNSEIAAVDQSDKNRCIFFFNLCTKWARVVAFVTQFSSNSSKLNAPIKEYRF